MPFVIINELLKKILNFKADRAGIFEHPVSTKKNTFAAISVHADPVFYGCRTDGWGTGNGNGAAYRHVPGPVRTVRRSQR